MPKKTSRKSKTQAFLALESKIASFVPVIKNGWWIKLSVVDGSIILVFVSDYTYQTLIRRFETESEAVSYINFVIECDPTKPVTP